MAHINVGSVASLGAMVGGEVYSYSMPRTGRDGIQGCAQARGHARDRSNGRTLRCSCRADDLGP